MALIFQCIYICNTIKINSLETYDLTEINFLLIFPSHFIIVDVHRYRNFLAIMIGRIDMGGLRELFPRKLAAEANANRGPTLYRVTRPKVKPRCRVIALAKRSAPP